MSANKTERQLNLLFLLLNTSQPLEREDIRRRIPGYSGKSNEAFERMFERDKEDLRDLDIPIETISVDVFHEDLQGYIIRKDKWLMSKISLTGPERAILNLAASAWQEAQISSSLELAVTQFSSRIEIEPNFKFENSKQSSAIATVLEAKSKNRCIQFAYLSANSNMQENRLVAPWRIFLSNGHGYLIGFDQQKGKQRTFKLSRIVGNLEITNEEILEMQPADLNVSQIIESWRFQDEVSTRVVLEIKPGSAGNLRVQASEIQLGKNFDKVVIETENVSALARDIAGNCSVVKVIEPLSVRDQVTQILEQAR